MDTKLKSFIERIENLNEDLKAVKDDVKDVYAEAKKEGYDTKIMRTVIKLRAMDKDVRDEQEALIDTYMNALEGTRVYTEAGE